MCLVLFWGVLLLKGRNGECILERVSSFVIVLGEGGD